jgi:hypothetical protein
MRTSRRAGVGTVRNAQLVLVATALAVAMPACSLIASIPSYDAVEPDAGTPAADSSPAPDGASTRDATLPDSAPETGDDSAVPEAASDSTVADAGPDVAAESAAPDATPDATESGAASDAGADAALDGSEDAANAADAGDANLTCGSNLLTAVSATASPSARSAASLAIDGDFTTRWESEWGVDPQWIYTDFGAPVYIDRVRILWQAACASNYLLQVSNDAVSWSTFGTVTGNATGAGNAPTDWSSDVDTTGIAGVGRYMRVYGITRCQTAYGYSIWEMQSFGGTNATCVPEQ